MDNADTTRNASKPNLSSGRRLEFVGLSLVSLIYALSVASTAFWLDSSELSAAAFSLGIPHPPAHPLFLYLGKAVSFVPLGPLHSV